MVLRANGRTLNVGAHTLRTQCRLCGHNFGTQPERILDLDYTPLANALPDDANGSQSVYPLFLTRCSSCDAVQLPVIVPKEDLFPVSYPYTTGASQTMRAHLEGLASLLMERFSPKRVLEIGSNDGTLLNLLRTKGCPHVEGIDPAASAARIAIENGISTTVAFFGEALLSVDEPYDLIVALNVFAHVDTMHGFADEVRRALHPEGVFIFEVGYFPDVVMSGNLGVVYHEHLSYHHLSPLRSFLKRHGLYIYHAERIASQGGSIRVFASPTKREETADLEILTLEETHLFRPALPLGVKYRFMSLIEAVWRRWGDTVKGLTSEDRIAFYGASAKLTTLLSIPSWSVDLESRVACVFDDDPRKIGKFAPGRPWRIKSGSELEQINPRKVIVTAPNMIDEIKARHPNYQGEWVSL